MSIDFTHNILCKHNYVCAENTCLIGEKMLGMCLSSQMLQPTINVMDTHNDHITMHVCRIINDTRLINR